MDTPFDAFMHTAAAAPDHAFLCAPPAAGRPYHPHGIELTYAQTRAEVLHFRDAIQYTHDQSVRLMNHGYTMDQLPERIPMPQYLIEDLGSTNGTFVNRGPRLLPGNKQPLKNGDEIIVGKTFLKFVLN